MKRPGPRIIDESFINYSVSQLVALILRNHYNGLINCDFVL